MKKSFMGRVKDGVLQLDDREAMKAALLKVKGVCWVTIETLKGGRSLEQNRYYWGVVVKLLSDHLGYESEEIHEILKYKFNRKSKEVRGEVIEYGGSTAKMSTVEFMEYIDQIQRWAAGLGVVIPDPNQEEFIDKETGEIQELANAGKE